MWLCAPSGSVATAEDPAAIATIQSAATFTDQPIKYLFKTEGAGGQVGQSYVRSFLVTCQVLFSDCCFHQEALELTFTGIYYT